MSDEIFQTPTDAELFDDLNEKLYGDLNEQAYEKIKALNPEAMLCRIEKLEALVENLINEIDQKAKVDSMWANAMVARNDKSF